MNFGYIFVTYLHCSILRPQSPALYYCINAVLSKSHCVITFHTSILYTGLSARHWAEK